MRSLPIVPCIFAILASPCATLASVSIYVGKNLTKDKSVLLAGFGDEPSSHWLVIVPRRQHPAGTTISVGGIATSRLSGELINIPQAPQTFRYISMDYSYLLGLTGTANQRRNERARSRGARRSTGLPARTGGDDAETAARA